MSKTQWKALALGLVAILTAIILAFATTMPTLAQITSINQFTDVKPNDYYYQALQSLVERYGCVVGYGDGTFQGDRPATRGEFAYNLNACLDKVTELIRAGASTTSSQENQASIASLEQRVQLIQQAVVKLIRSREGAPNNRPI
ncbi:MAG: S-layer homology domain-containing protein [Oscillatoriales cyanobacterium RU_3_3]|nr:S-layer homology domain-containing protein [Microcoleus sp. SU_5_3]NJL65669.1 S-layer homology domain-containing protein [Microcoleus sp. SM1_3_4]NJM58957.1 S-layer homology domain-containing protein [Oscillatoriales cyanobacterium RU_3_3]